MSAFSAPLALSAIPLPLLVLAGAVLFLLLKYRDGRAIGTDKRDDVRTIRGIPLIGNTFEMLRNIDRMLENIMINRDKDSSDPRPVSVTFPWKRSIDCSRPEWLEIIQKTRFESFAKGPEFHDITRDVLGDGIFATDGERWRSQRKATSRVFTGNSFRGVITNSLETSVETLLSVLRRHAATGTEFSLDALFFSFTLDSFSKMAFGISIGSMESDSPLPFAEAFDDAQGILESRFINPIWRITERFNGKARRMDANRKILHSFCDEVIANRRKEGIKDMKSADKKEAESLDLLSLYMALRDDYGQPLSDSTLRDALLNLLIAGRDTTAQALSWTFYHLMRQPDLQHSIRKEIAENGQIDYDSFHSMHQTNAAFEEGLRLHPSVPKNLWKVLRDEQLPNGPLLKAGDFVSWSDWCMNRDTNLWGPSARDYIPSRWIDESGHLRRFSQWQNHVFNGGYRLCLGQELAKYEACLAMATILKEFDISFASDYLETVKMSEIEETPRYRSSLTLPMLEPLRVRVKARSS